MYLCLDQLTAGLPSQADDLLFLTYLYKELYKIFSGKLKKKFIVFHENWTNNRQGT